MVVGSYSLHTTNQDDKTFSINILIPHGQSQSWYMYPIKERDIIPFLIYISTWYEIIKRENPLLQQLKLKRPINCVVCIN